MSACARCRELAEEVARLRAEIARLRSEMPSLTAADLAGLARRSQT